MEYLYKGSNKLKGRVNKTKLLGCVCGNVSEHLIHLIIVYIILCTHTRVKAGSHCFDKVLCSENNVFNLIIHSPNLKIQIQLHE